MAETKIKVTKASVVKFIAAVENASPECPVSYV